MKKTGQTKTEREYIKDMNAPVNAFDVLQMLGCIPLIIVIFMLEISETVIPPWWVSLLLMFSIAFIAFLLIVKYNSKNVASHILVALVISSMVSFTFGLLFFGINWSSGVVDFSPAEFNYILFTTLPAFGVSILLDVAGK